MDTIIVRKGSGYTGCTAFNGYTVIAAPLPGRDERVFGNVTYASHELQLAQDEFGDLFILMQHGAGRRVIRFRPPSDGGAIRAAILAMEPRLQYALLYTVARMAENTDAVARRETQAEWAQAYCDGRIRKSRAKQGRRTVEILPAADSPSQAHHA